MYWYLGNNVPNVIPLDCPLCMKSNKVWAGVDSCSTSGVGCSRCHLTITCGFPTNLPAG